jgi:protein kinase A
MVISPNICSNVRFLPTFASQTQSIPLQGWMGRNDDTSSSGGRTLRKSMQQQMDSSSLKTRGRLSLLIQSKRFEEPGQNILEHEAEDDPAVYVVREGQVKVQYTDGKGTAQEKTVDVGGVFGDEHLLKAQHDDDSSPTAATISRPADYTAQVTGDGPVSVGVLPIKKIVEEQKKIEEQTVDEEELPAVPEEKDIEEAFTSKTPTAVSLSLQQKIRQAVKANVGLNDLEKIRVLGEGQYGEVWLVETDVFQTGVDTLKQRFALKSQFMTDDTRGDEARQAIGREIDILQTLTQTTPHAGIVNLVQTYQDEECIYMLMGLIPGGELWSRIHQEVSEGEWKSGMSEESAKFYTYVLADTMGFLHSQHILFRDMKPENVMLDEDGYPVLVDFGFAKRVPEGEKTFTFCGTPNYVAPEIILQSGHDKAADYWALGVTMYEMVSGENPFYYDGMDQVTLYDTIVREQFYAYSKPPSDALMDLSYQILEKEPHQRLGSLAGGTRDITKHAWFAELDSTAIRSKKLAAPWKPNSDKKVEVDEEAMEEILACFETEEESTHYDDEDNAGGLLDEEPLEELPYSIEPSFSNVAPGSFRIDEAEEEESCDELDLYDLAEENSESEHEINSDDDTIEGEMDLNTPETERETVDVLEQSHKATNDSLSVPPRSSTLSHEGKSSRKSVLSPSISPRRKANRRDREKHKKERKSTVLGALAGLGLGDSMGALGFDMDALDEKGDE